MYAGKRAERHREPFFIILSQFFLRRISYKTVDLVDFDRICREKLYISAFVSGHGDDVFIIGFVLQGQKYRLIDGSRHERIDLRLADFDYRRNDFMIEIKIAGKQYAD